MLPADTTSDDGIITINNVTVDDEGVYTCTVSNEGGESSYDIFIMIIGENQLFSNTYICSYVCKLCTLKLSVRG